MCIIISKISFLSPANSWKGQASTDCRFCDFALAGPTSHTSHGFWQKSRVSLGWPEGERQMWSGKILHKCTLPIIPLCVICNFRIQKSWNLSKIPYHCRSFQLQMSLILLAYFINITNMAAVHTPEVVVTLVPFNTRPWNTLANLWRIWADFCNFFFAQNVNMVTLSYTQMLFHLIAITDEPYKQPKLHTCLC